MIFEIKKQEDGNYTVVGTSDFIIYNCNHMTLDDAAIKCWQEKNPAKRYQIWANCFSGHKELTWYSQDDHIVIPNGYATIEEARLDIVRDLKEVCFNNDYETHPNRHGDYSIIDTFTGDEVDYQISEDEARHPDPSVTEDYDV